MKTIQDALLCLMSVALFALLDAGLFWAIDMWSEIITGNPLPYLGKLSFGKIYLFCLLIEFVFWTIADRVRWYSDIKDGK